MGKKSVGIRLSTEEEEEFEELVDKGMSKSDAARYLLAKADPPEPKEDKEEKDEDKFGVRKTVAGVENQIIEEVVSPIISKAGKDVSNAIANDKKPPIVLPSGASPRTIEKARRDGEESVKNEYERKAILKRMKDLENDIRIGQDPVAIISQIDEVVQHVRSSPVLSQDQGLKSDIVNIFGDNVPAMLDMAGRWMDVQDRKADVDKRKAMLEIEIAGKTKNIDYLRTMNTVFNDIIVQQKNAGVINEEDATDLVKSYLLEITKTLPQMLIGNNGRGGGKQSDTEEGDDEEEDKRESVEVKL